MSTAAANKDAIAKLAQASFSGNPVIILGSGASMPHNLPSMGELQTHLLANILPVGSDEEDNWLLVKNAFANGDHLEQALTGKVLPPSLVRKIVNQTWECVNAADKRAFLRTLDQKEQFPLGSLIKSLFQSANNTVHVVTTNYDRIAEYACNSHRITYSTGFMPGYIREREGSDQLTYMRGSHQERVARIWKVHGSLDWFKSSEGETYSAPVFELPPNDALPLIVTPGFNKFEQTHLEPFRSTMAGADRALESAQAFIAVGYGFRDDHVQEKILKRCREQTIPVVMLARTLTDEARDFLKNKAGNKYLGLEMKADKTRAFSNNFPDGQDLDVADLWTLSGFIGLVT
jgi:SIR2-like domain